MRPSCTCKRVLQKHPLRIARIRSCRTRTAAVHMFRTTYAGAHVHADAVCVLYLPCLDAYTIFRCSCMDLRSYRCSMQISCISLSAALSRILTRGIVVCVIPHEEGKLPVCQSLYLPDTVLVELLSDGGKGRGHLSPAAPGYGHGEQDL